MTIVEMLKRSRERIARGWCQDSYAEDKEGRRTSPLSNFACAWCMMGALRPEGIECMAAEPFLRRLVPHHALAQFNDAPGRTQAEVLAVYDKAIAMAEAEEKQ